MTVEPFIVAREPALLAGMAYPRDVPGTVLVCALRYPPSGRGDPGRPVPPAGLAESPWQETVAREL